MTAPAYTVAADRLGSEVLAGHARPRHPPLPRASRRPAGCSASWRTPTWSPPRRARRFTCAAAIARATTIDALVAAARELRPTIVALHRARTAPLHIAGIYSVVVDALIRRLIELAVAEPARRRRRSPGWRWAASRGARRCRAPTSTAPSPGAARTTDRAIRRLRAWRSAGGSTAGLRGLRPARSTARGTTAANPLLVRSAGVLAARGASWLEDPTQEQALILVSVVVDSRPVWGIRTGVSRRRGLPRRAPAPGAAAPAGALLALATARRPASCAGSSSSTPASTAASSTSSTAASCRSSTSPAGRGWRRGDQRLDARAPAAPPPRRARSPPPTRATLADAFELVMGLRARPPGRADRGRRRARRPHRSRHAQPADPQLPQGGVPRRGLGAEGRLDQLDHGSAMTALPFRPDN